MSVRARRNGTPRLPAFPQHGRENEPLDLSFIAIRPALDGMGSFLLAHYRDWSRLTGEPTEAKPPRSASYQTIRTIEFHYSLDITDLEKQYITSLARWAALRVGGLRNQTLGALSKTAKKQGHTDENKNTYRAPCLFYNGHEKWLVVREEIWKQKLSPERMGVGVLCDEHGFVSQEQARGRQMRVHTQDMGGIELPQMRLVRETEQDQEAMILRELRRLSSLWVA